MILGIVIEISVAFVFLFLGRSVYKGNINLIHEYHTRKVKESDMQEYCKLFSKGLFLIGTGVLISSFFTYKEMGIGVLLSIFIGILSGILIIIKAQKKYNSGL